MMKRKTFLALILIAIAFIVSLKRNTIAQYTATVKVVAADDFETPTTWHTFEEIVNGNECYDEGIGSVSRSSEYAYEGTYSLKVWANQANALKSNHLIAYKDIFSQGQTGIWQYSVYAFVPSDAHGNGQTGPELSIQNTRSDGSGGYKTTTAGIQYIANVHWVGEYGNWKVWAETTPSIADWITFTAEEVEPDTWYLLTLEADYFTNTYRSFSVQGGSVNKSYDLSMFKIAEETKFTAESFVVTLESENLWNNCEPPGYNYPVYYDLLTLSQEVETVFLPFVIKP